MKLKIVKSGIALMTVIMLSAFIFPVWEIPEKYKKVPNPYPEQGLKTGEKIYKRTCTACHLSTGKGIRDITPVDFTSEAFQAQTDGTLFYKISEGRKGTAMKSYGDDFPEKKLWYLVNYLRTFKEEEKKK